MKTTLDLPDELVRRMKVRAVLEGKPLKRLVAELLSQGLNAPAGPRPAAAGVPESHHIVLNDRGFPVVRCGPNAPASKMTAQDLIEFEQQALQEEDMHRAGIPL